MSKDIDFSFKMHPLTKDLATKSGSSAIKQSLVNLVRTNFYDRGFNMEVGGNLDYSLFENTTILTLQQVKTNVENVINNFESRVELLDVSVTSPDDNSLMVTIYYTELNNPSEQSVTIDLKRVR
jgi:phage baseplate assembly protein W